MSVNFSTITPMNPSTISQKPAFSVDTGATEQKPTASSPLDAYQTQQPKKNKHTFLKIVGTLAVLTAAVGLLRGKVDMIKNFDVKAPLAADAKLLEKGKHYALKGIAVAGDFVNNYFNKAVNFVKNLLPKKTNP